MRRIFAIAFLLMGAIGVRLLLAATGGNGAFPTLTAPADASWTRVAGGPILEPSDTWEETIVNEPTVLFEDGVWKMWYLGGWNNPGLGYAECSGDPRVAANWMRHGSPVYGQGGSGYAGTSNGGEVSNRSGTYWLYTTGTGPALRVATSSDGLSWTTQSNSISLPSGTTLWGNRTVWLEGSTWYMLQEAGLVGGTYWATYLYTSSDSLTWSIANGGAQLSTLQVTAGGMYGGPFRLGSIGGEHVIFYHAASAAGNVPTDVYRATSADRINWTIDPAGAVVTHTGTGYEVDQAADPSVVVVGGTAYMFFSGVDNASESGAIFLATAPAVR